MTESTENVGALEKPSDAGKGSAGVVARWNMEWDLAGKVEKTWRDRAQKAVDRYRDEKERSGSKFNVLYANTEIMRPSLYNSTPKPDIRRRFRDKDPVGKEAAEILERVLSFQLDCYDFDAVAQLAILDYLLPGRAVTRVRFEPSFEKKTPAQGEAYDALAYAEIKCEHVDWKYFRRGPGRTWTEVTWVGFEHHLTREQIKEKFPGFEGKVSRDFTPDDAPECKDEQEKDLWSRTVVREIWDKETRKVLFIAPSYADEPLKVEDDPLELKDFFPIPRPLYAVESTDTLVPIEEYRVYKDQAEELDRITARINRIISGLKLRGIYDSTVKEFEQLFSADDNAMIPAEKATTFVTGQAGGLNNAVWMLPIEQAAKVLLQLYQNREQIKQTIYEITGLSDILRGSTDPGETLGAQKLKAHTGSLRLQRRQRDVQRYIRDLIRIKAEIVAQNFTPEMLAMMTGVPLPFAQQKEAAQQMLALAQKGQTGPDGQPAPIPPEVQAKLKEAKAVVAKPSWEEVMQVLRSDAMREFRIDIETDSTIAADQQYDREQIVEAMDAITRYVSGVGPIVQQGMMPASAAVGLLQTIVRRFKFGRQVEDVLDHMADDEQTQGAQKPPSAEEIKAQAEAQRAQIENQRTQMEIQAKQQELAQKAQAEALKAQAEERRMAMEAQIAAAEHAARLEEIELNRQAKREEHQMRLAEMAARVTARVRPKPQQGARA